ncbi:MAG: CusA/CzcA family heavy metal efflux RND transporter [Acidobacteriota bacterium]
MLLRKIIDFHLDHRFFVVVGLLGLVLVGLWSLSRLPIDAFPDLTNNQVVVITEAAGMAPAEVEQMISFPIEAAMMGLPRTEKVRSISKLGLSIVTIVFDDSVPVYLARQLVAERLNEARSRIPSQLDPTLGPVASAFGEIFQYTVEGSGYSAMELKTLHDWQMKYPLRAVPGVNEINSWGGLTQQYHVVVNPERLRHFSLTLRDIFERIRENNENFGGGFIEHASEQYTVRGLGRLQSPKEIEDIVVASHQGTPVYLREVAQVQVGAMPRQGAVTRDGQGETVSGMVIMLKGENGKEVIERVKEKLSAIRKIVPEGVQIRPFYDQSEVISRTIRTVRNNLLEGGLLVIGVLFLFLGNVRGALLVAAVIPLSMLIAFAGMQFFGISANLMSLGAIDFGLIVDGSVVMMENFVRRLHATSGSTQFRPREEIRTAAHEVARPIVFGIAIIIAVYLPIFTLEGLEGRMFRPMAVTVCSAILGSLILALTVVPAASALVFRSPLPAHREAWMLVAHKVYRNTLEWVLAHRFVTIGVSAVLVVVALGSLAVIGTEFMPRLDEGAILIETRKLPSVSLSQSVEMSGDIERILRGFPEVESVVTKIGRPDLATEAMGIYQGDVYVMLKPSSQWPTRRNKEQLIEAMANELQKYPGVAYNFTQPMAMRLDEVISGVKADVAVKIFGEDDRVLDERADEVLRLLSGIPGAADVQKEIFSGAAEWQIDLNRAELARFGLNVSDVRDLVETAVSGKLATEMIEGQRRFGVLLRLPASYRQDRASLSALQLRGAGGELISLDQVASIHQSTAPEIITREDSQRRIVVQANVRGRDLGGFVKEARRVVEGRVTLPSGYYFQWGGQFENQQRAMNRLTIVVPAAILLIFLLLFSAFDSVRQALLILLNVPFAAVGGVAALWLRGLNLNLSASVGFIALFGVAVLNGVVMVSYFNRLLLEGKSLREAILEGALVRLRPVLMTALVASLGFLPMAVATSAGAEIQRPLATVVIGGLVTSTLLTLIVLPALFSLGGARSSSRS